MASNSVHDHDVLAADRDVAIEYSGNPAVAALYETPYAGRHHRRTRVSVEIGRGFTGDHERKSFWKGKYVPGREVSACAIEVLELFRVDPAVVGDNLVTRGIDLSALRPGQRVLVGSVELCRSDREHRPCATFRERTSDAAFRFAAKGFRGALFTVVQGGEIREGDSIEIFR